MRTAKCAAGRGRQCSTVVADLAVFGQPSVARHEFDECHFLSPAAIPMNGDDNAKSQTNPTETPLVPNNQRFPSEKLRARINCLGNGADSSP
jgi:hypothetical protein